MYYYDNKKNMMVEMEIVKLIRQALAADRSDPITRKDGKEVKSA